MATKSAEQRLEAAQKALAKAEAAMKRAAAELAEKDRRADTRRKVIIGGAILARAAKDAGAAKSLRNLLDGLPAKDKAAFQGWTPPAPSPAPVAQTIIIS